MQRSSFPSSVQASLADFGQQFCYCIFAAQRELPGRRAGERDGAQCGKLESSEAVARIRRRVYSIP